MVPETGPSLLYSLGPVRGFVAVALYPARSEAGGVHEEIIFLRIGPYGALWLHAQLSSDLNDLVSYAFVSSLETTPTLRDRLRFWWLRKTHPQQLEGKFALPLSVGQLISAASKFTAASLTIALLRPLGILAAYFLLVYLGLATLSDHLH
jgi:hypothetical protein